jgi:hypothetical protein
MAQKGSFWETIRPMKKWKYCDPQKPPSRMTMRRMMYIDRQKWPNYFH